MTPEPAPAEPLGTSSRGLAMTASIASAVCVLLLLPLLYLMVDLFTWQGRWPGYQELSPGRQEQFRQEWNSTYGDRADIKALIPNVPHANELDEWKLRWQATTSLWLKNLLGTKWIEAREAESSGPDSVIADPRYGLLSTVILEHHRPTGWILGKLCQVFPALWTPGESGSANGRALAVLGLLALLLAVAAAGLHRVAYRQALDGSLQSAGKLRRSVYRHANRLGAVATNPAVRDEAARILTDRIETIERNSPSTTTTRIAAPLLVVGALAFALLIHPFAALVLFLFGMAGWLIVGHSAARARRTARIAERSLATARSQLLEAVGITRLVRAFLMERYAQTRVERHIDECSRTQRQREDGAYAAAARISWILLAGFVLSLIVLGAFVMFGTLSPAGLATMLAASTVSVVALRRGLHASANRQMARMAAADVAEFLSRRGDAGQSIDAEFLQPVGRALQCIGVSLREAGTGHMILEDVSLSVPAGTRAAIVSTNRDTLRCLASLLTRFAEPTAGEIKADDKNIRWLTVDSVRTQIAYVSTDLMTITDTVANNIGGGDPSFGLPQIMEAAKIAHAHQFIQRLPYGYETLIGSGGVALTEGQQFRIALARAILRDPSVILIEEPSLAFDPDSQALLNDTYARIQNRRTLILFPSRESSARMADRVFVLERGRLVASGTHEMLLQSSDLYRRLQERDVSGPVGAA